MSPFTVSRFSSSFVLIVNRALQCTRFASEAVLPDSAILTALEARPMTRALGSFIAVLASRDAANEMSEDSTMETWTSKVAILSS